MSTKVSAMETEIWQQYEQGVDYKARIGLYRTVDLNERFYCGRSVGGRAARGAAHARGQLHQVRVGMEDRGGDGTETEVCSSSRTA